MGLKEIFAERFQRSLGRRRWVARMALKVRNQANGVIAAHLGETCNPQHNGEFLLLDHLAPECRCFVDVGANVGDWTERLLAGNPNAKGYLFEPLPDACSLLRSRFRGMDIKVRQLALALHAALYTALCSPWRRFLVEASHRGGALRLNMPFSHLLATS